MIKSIKKSQLVAVILAITTAIALLLGGVLLKTSNAERNGLEYLHKGDGGSYYGSMADVAQGYTNQFLLTRMKSLGASHYAYTEGISDEFNSGNPNGDESIFNGGSSLVRLNVDEETGKVTEEILLDSNSGVYRDVDVSIDGKTAVFSYKGSALDDDFHLYTMDLETLEPVQITFGQGVADFEPKWLADGRIVFSSSRIVQRIDCWKVPVSNMYICNADGTNMIRVGYDQVHTTYPTTTSDGRVIYTRWDYNDRNQMYVQGVFQMFQDGTNQTELYGNNSNYPTTMMHTREIPGNSTKYISIASGHHTWQAGKLAFIDLNEGENSKEAIKYPYEKPSDMGDDVDIMGQDGVIYKYPYAINEDEFFVAMAPTGWASNKAATVFNLYYCNLTTGVKQLIVAGSSSRPVGQIVPIVDRNMFKRPSMVNYGTNTGTFYISDIYDGPGLKGVEEGLAKYLRVVAIDYRPYAIGSNWQEGTGTADPSTPVSTANGTWDIKRVLGIVPIEDDGSVMFSCPAETPVYFQVLDENGQMIQSMRSWTTLMPNESFSCVGCHEPKSEAPAIGGTITKAMKKGVQTLEKDLWMTGERYENYDPYTDSTGFSYLKEVQPILDESCVSCHVDKSEAGRYIGNTNISGGTGSSAISLESTPVTGPREKLNFALSYLVLTDSKLRGDFYFGNPNSGNTNWISSMSQCEMLDPYKYGSSVSKVTQMLMDGHGDLTEEQIQTISAWIDLGVPFRGSYSEAANWDNNMLYHAEESNYQRAYYEMMDRKNKDRITGVDDKREFEMVYTSGSKEPQIFTGKGFAQMYIQGGYKTNDIITIALPEGEQYAYLNLNHKMATTLLYAPDGVINYKIPTYANQVFNKQFMRYKTACVTVYLPSEKDLTSISNLALNPFDIGEEGVYPKVNASNSFGGGTDYQFVPRNAIDGYNANKAHVGYQGTSWGPELNAKDLEYEIDFGREIEISELIFFLRADFPHDTIFDSFDIVFSNEDDEVDMVSASFIKTAAAQSVVFDPIKATKVTLKNFHTLKNTSGSDWAAITEIQVMGKNIIKK